MTEQRKIIPNLFIVGAPKAATYSIYYYLNQHPEICMSKIKEPNYFYDGINNSDTVTVVKDWDAYVKLFRFKDEYVYYGEASPSYLHCTKTSFQIHKIIPNAKIIIILRNPVERAYSAWLMDKREGYQKKDFISAFIEDYERSKDGNDYLFYMYYRGSMYHDALERYLQLFKSNVKVLLYEDIKTNLHNVLSNINEFLDINKYRYNTARKLNQAGYPRNKLFEKIYHNTNLRKVVSKFIPQSFKINIKQIIMDKKKISNSLSNDLRNELIEYFRDDILNTEKLINRDLTNWLKMKDMP